MPLTSIIWREKTETLRHQSDPIGLIICFHYYLNEHKLRQVLKLTFLTLSKKSFWTKFANIFLSITQQEQMISPNGSDLIWSPLFICI